MSNLDYWVLLHSIAGMGPATYRKLLRIFGEPQRVFEATPQELIKIGLSKNLVTSIISPPSLGFINNILLKLKRRQFKIITLYDENYPDRLKGIKNPPPILYVYGELVEAKSIALIGTTQPSQEGLQKAFKFAYELAGSGFTIVSGYARGIDTQAHLGAIKGGGKTVMALPTGVLNFRTHKELLPATDALFSQGAILSEFFPTAPWTTAQAMLRNRITSGLSDAVLVIEPGTKGGTLSTVRWAKQQDKLIFICRDEVTSPLHFSPRGKEILEMGAVKVRESNEIIKCL